MPRHNTFQNDMPSTLNSISDAVDLFQQYGSPTEPTRILAVDDRPENLRALHEILDPLPVEIVDATSGAEALSILLRETFALVLLDVEMPGMSGLEVAEIMLNNELTRNVPIIFVTAADISNTNVVKAYQTGAVDFLQKPIPEEMLCGKIAVFLELYEYRRHLEDLLSDLQDSRADLAAQNEMFRNFSSFAAHDLRAPMRQMAHLAQCISDSLETNPQECREHVKVMLNSAKRGMTLIDKLIDYSKAAIGFDETETIDLNILVKDIIDVLAGADPDKNIREAVTLGPLPTTRCNGLQLGRVFQNLISNGLKYQCPDLPPAIEIGCTTDEKSHTFYIQDNGVGIPEKAMDRIFNPLFRANNTVAGTGLGLSICKLIVEEHRGKIWCESKTGQGTRFEFSIPRNGCTQAESLKPEDINHPAPQDEAPPSNGNDQGP